MKKIKHIFQMILQKISAFMDTPFFAILFAAVELFSYYMGLDLVIILFVSISLTFAALFKKNLNVLLIIFFFMSSMISYNNSPANTFDWNNNQYYFQPGVFIPCIIGAAIPISIIIVRSIMNIVKKRIKFNAVFFSVIALGVAFLINGNFTSPYNPANLMFGVFMLFFFVILYFGVAPDVSVNSDNILNICRSVAIYAIVPVVETIVIFIKGFAKGLPFADIRTFYGWGNENTVGMLLVVIFCFLLYLFRYEKNLLLKGLSHLMGLLVFICVILIVSRQAYLFLAALIGAYLLLLIITSKGKTRIKSIIFLSVLAVAGIASIIILENDGVLQVLGIDFDNGGRFELWTLTFDSFVEHPIFGGGFYFLGGDPVIKLDSVMPLCCHNTLFEMLGACGIVGLLCYLTYRTFTVICIVKNFTKEKLYPIMGLSVMVLMSLIDIHILDLLGSALYIMLLAMSMSPKANDIKTEETKVITQE